MRIVVAGGTGFLGTPLCRAFVADGHEVVALSRSADPVGEPVWRSEPRLVHGRWSASQDLDGWGHVLDGADAVVNLAGESIGSGRWTDERKAQLVQSRLQSTRGLGRAMAVAAAPPRTLINASAVGYYGDRGDEVITEASRPGHDFLARLCVDWEDEARRAGGDRTRVVLLRTGLVLDEDGGAFQQMRWPFKLGIGGPFGSGRQYMPWIHRTDWVALVVWLLGRTEDGPFNVTGPAPVPNREFARTLGKALGRPAIVPVPRFALRLVLGELADALVGGQRALPARAEDLGFRFTYPRLSGALAAIVR